MKSKNSIFYAIMFLFILIIVVPLLYLTNKMLKRYREQTAIIRELSVEPSPMYSDDLLLGFKAIPGNYKLKIKLSNLKEEKVYNVTINDDGTRSTGLARDKAPELWIFGCSFVWGQGLNDEETMAYQVQKARPDLKVINFGENGYGNHHALLQIKELIKSKRVPKYIVISYIDWHSQRNIAAKEYVAALRTFGPFNSKNFFVEQIDSIRNTIYFKLGIPPRDEDVRFHFPQAYLDSNELKIRTIPLLKEYVPNVNAGDQGLITEKIFDEIYEEARRVNVTPVILHMWSSGDYQQDPVVKHLKEKGFLYVDAFRDYSKPEFNMLPYDGHPNAEVNLFYAEKLLKAIK